MYSFNQLFIPRMQEIYLLCSSLQPQYPHVMCNERIFLIELKKNYVMIWTYPYILKVKFLRKKVVFLYFKNNDHR